MESPKEALAAAIDAAGSQTALAAKLSEFFRDQENPQLKNWVVTQAHVATWVSRGRAAGRACRGIEALTGVPSQRLRPDLFYGEISPCQ